VAATLRFASGAVGTFSLTFVTGVPWESPLYVVGERGALRISPATLEIMTEGSVRRESFQEDTVLAELADFAYAIRQGKDHRNTARHALGDVAVIEAMFASTEYEAFVRPEAI
jgi:predicted dehydrogenase